MESLSVDELMSQIAQDDAAPTEPGCFYSKDGDCIFCHIEDVPYYADRVDELLTVYLAEEDGRLVGAQSKGVSKLPTHDALGLELRREGNVQVVELLLLTFQSQPKAASEDTGVVRRKAKYFDVVTRLHGFSIPAAELQTA
ncbi:MAG: hypothetical protein D6731_17260 [Planctomycetota bacterium]|nr:MAG: hypothetical protein D6731_17260 [Planctomycetota bacterium]